jgi:hypothetical protein
MKRVLEQLVVVMPCCAELAMQCDKPAMQCVKLAMLHPTSHPTLTRAHVIGAGTLHTAKISSGCFRCTAASHLSSLVDVFRYSELVVASELISYYDVSGCYILRPSSFAMWEVRAR